ncbi:hypothetical protein TYRP_017219 [Tyrophagus putrescentiae]|nr:hypothetical protein TYRP_017219 [Tyrophagus putrescentiae]
MKAFITLAVLALVAVSVQGRAVRDTKSDLITKGNDLLKKADEAVTKLGHNHQRQHEAALIKAEEAQIKHLLKELEAATDDAKVTRIEHELGRAEVRLQHTLERVSHVPAKRDVKSDLITKGNDLVKRADEAVAKLPADKRHEAALIKAEETQIKHLVKELEAATTPLRVTALEHELARAEVRLQHTLDRIHT